MLHVPESTDHSGYFDAADLSVSLFLFLEYKDLRTLPVDF